MSVVVSKKLSSSFEGALAGGGDPATSPLYVFGPFLKLIVVAGVANVTFGATMWLAVLSVIMVSMMYRQVMTWVTDGSGGSGLSEEEFGSWAVKINGGITVIEYALTYMVSMAALVTFVADRFPVLNEHLLGLQYRAILALLISLFVAWVVNLGPKVSARAFGPATGALLLLLWGLIVVAIYRLGFHLPDFNLQAFSTDPVSYVGEDGATVESSYLHLTLGGYARILAVMTGIEIFANLVAAYDGKRAEKSKKAFGSLIIIMGTTLMTMLVIGPVIHAHSDPLNAHVSVFTQMMDFLLPPTLSYIGTLIGIAVLLSACAAAAQAIQNLSMGLRYRHYVSAKIGQRNKHDVADVPVWIMIGVSSVCFIFFGTQEETYLALYAAGVFILLSMTGWAASKRLLRELRMESSFRKLMGLIGTTLAALITSFATVIIFEERFFDGAWSYLVMVPVFYAIFSYYYTRLGPPPSVEDRLGRMVQGQSYVPQIAPIGRPSEKFFRKILVHLDGTASAEQTLPMVRFLARAYDTEIDVVLTADEQVMNKTEQLNYLDVVTNALTQDGFTTSYKTCQGDAASMIDRRAITTQADLIIMTVANSAVEKLFAGSVASQVIKKTLVPTMLIRPTDAWRSRYSKFKHILVALDGSESAESVLPYIRVFTHHFQSKVLLLSVPEGSESEEYGDTIQRYLQNIANTLAAEGAEVSTLFTGSGPARTILAVSEAEQVDLIMMASHGRGGVTRETIHLGSVTEKVAQTAPCPLFVVPLTRSTG